MSESREVEVSQADRDLAADFARKGWHYARRIREGKQDSHPLVQAAARHRNLPAGSDSAGSGVLNVFGDGSFTITREGTDAAIAATHDDHVCSIPLEDIRATPSLSRDEGWHRITATVGPILKAAFPEAHSITRLQAAEAIATALEHPATTRAEGIAHPPQDPPHE